VGILSGGSRESKEGGGQEGLFQSHRVRSGDFKFAFVLALIAANDVISISSSEKWGF